MPDVFVVVERAFRGGLEEQFAHVLWLAHGLSAQNELSLLLRSTAARHAVRETPREFTTPAPATVRPRADYSEKLSAMVDAGVPVMVEHESLSQMGLVDSRSSLTTGLLPGVRVIDRTDVARCILEADRVWFL